MAGWTSLIPLLVLFILVGVAAFIGYHLYLWSNELAERANASMEKKNVKFTKEGGLRVGVKEVKQENYADKTQNVLVNIWNSAELPAQKSVFGWSSTQADAKKSSGGGGGNTTRPSAPRTSSSTSRPSASRASSSANDIRSGRSMASGSSLAPPAKQGSQKRSASPVPGGWEDS